LSRIGRLSQASVGLRGPAYDPAGKGCGKQLDVIGGLDRQAGRGGAGRQFVQRLRELGAVRAREGRVAAASGDDGAMTIGELAEWTRCSAEVFQRRQCLAKPGDEIGGCFER
jgi:hypothetical protein